MNELESMRAFVKVVEVGSFAEAARQIGTSKSVITSRINQLEEHLELVLLQRSTRGLSINDTGADFYERCLRVLAEVDEAKSAVKSMEWGLSGTLRISCVSSFIATCLANDLCEFQAQHPDLKIDLQQHDRFCDPVQEGIDISIHHAIAPSDIIQKVDFLSVNRLVMATPQYVEKHGKPMHPNELIQHRFAHNSYILPFHELNYIMDNKVVKAPYEPVVSSNSIWMIKAAVLRGDCIAMMPAFFVEKELLSGELVPILQDFHIQSTCLSAFFRKSSFVPMKIRIFLNFLQKQYGGIPPWERRLLKKRPELSISLGD